MHFDKEAIKDMTEREKIIYGDRDGFYGWMGLGGSVFQWHPELKISFAYVPNDLMVTDFINMRGRRLQKIVCDISMKNI